MTKIYRIVQLGDVPIYRIEEQKKGWFRALRWVRVKEYDMWGDACYNEYETIDVALNSVRKLQYRDKVRQLREYDGIGLWRKVWP